MFSHIEVKDHLEKDRDIRIAPFKKDKRKTSAHKHNNYFEIVYLSRGDGHHYIDTFKYPIIPPVMFFIRKEQVHHWDITSEPDGFVAIIKKSFVDKSLDNELKSLFERISERNCLRLIDDTAIQQLMKMLVAENRANDESKFQITEALLKTLLVKTLEVTDTCHTKFKSDITDIYHSYLNLLRDNGHVKNKVKFYATQLNTTPQNLNAICRKEVNRSAAQVAAEFIMSEAKRLLLYSNKTVSGISFALNFKDPSHFVKYFKKITGHTPQSFRESSQ